MGYIGYRGPRCVVTFTATAAITKGWCVSLDTTEGNVVKAPTVTTEAIGIAENTAAAGQAVDVCVLGMTLAMADDVVAAGAWLQPSDTATLGCLKTAVATGYVLGHALTAATAANDLILFQVSPFYKVLS